MRPIRPGEAGGESIGETVHAAMAAAGAAIAGAGCAWMILDDDVDVLKYLVLLDAHDAPAEPSEDPISMSIVAAPALVVRTIDLDDEAALRAGEVGDVGPDDELPAERKAGLGA
jgi:hypothetical protein